MKNIGMFYNTTYEMREAFKAHADRSDPIHYDCYVKVCPRSETITIDNIRWMYYTFREDKDVMQIAGINFDAIFSEVVNPYCKQWIMTRFRPGLNK
jgi:hypothetical protein